MSCLILPRRFYSQPSGIPEIDWNNPLSSGLLFKPSIATATELVSDIPFPVDRALHTSGASGVGLDFPGTQSLGLTSYGNAAANKFNYQTELSVSTVFQVRTLSNDQKIIGVWGSTITNEAWLLTVGTNGSIGFGAYDLGAAYLLSSAASIIQIGNTYSIAASWRQGVIKLSVNGVSVAIDITAWVTDTVTRLNPATSTGSLILGCSADVLSDRLNGVIYDTSIWNRCLSQEELCEVSRNPWQIFKGK